MKTATNSLAKSKNTQPKFSTAIQSEGIQKLISRALQDPNRVRRFTASIISSFSANPDLQRCDATSVVSSALLGESLNLSPSPQLGYYYLLPFNNKDKGIPTAQFCMGYKGYIQLALRSGYYRSIGASPVLEGEYKGRDKFTGDPIIEFLDDDSMLDSVPVVGYTAYLELLNGFRKRIYWRKEKVENHAKTYSPGYARDLEKGTSYTFWSRDFDGMACKTMLRQLLPKWGIMSVEMQQAFEADYVAEKNADDVFEVPVMQTSGGENDLDEQPVEASFMPDATEQDGTSQAEDDVVGSFFD